MNKTASKLSNINEIQTYNNNNIDNLPSMIQIYIDKSMQNQIQKYIEKNIKLINNQNSSIAQCQIKNNLQSQQQQVLIAMMSYFNQREQDYQQSIKILNQTHINQQQTLSNTHKSYKQSYTIKSNKQNEIISNLSSQLTIKQQNIKNILQTNSKLNKKVHTLENKLIKYQAVIQKLQYKNNKLTDNLRQIDQQIRCNLYQAVKKKQQMECIVWRIQGYVEEGMYGLSYSSDANNYNYKYNEYQQSINTKIQNKLHQYQQKQLQIISIVSQIYMNMIEYSPTTTIMDAINQQQQLQQSQQQLKLQQQASNKQYKWFNLQETLKQLQSQTNKLLQTISSLKSQKKQSSKKYQNFLQQAKSKMHIIKDKNNQYSNKIQTLTKDKQTITKQRDNLHRNIKLINDDIQKHKKQNVNKKQAIVKLSVQLNRIKQELRQIKQIHVLDINRKEKENNQKQVEICSLKDCLETLKSTFQAVIISSKDICINQFNCQNQQEIEIQGRQSRILKNNENIKNSEEDLHTDFKQQNNNAQVSNVNNKSNRKIEVQKSKEEQNNNESQNEKSINRQQNLIKKQSSKRKSAKQNRIQLQLDSNIMEHMIDKTYSVRMQNSALKNEISSMLEKHKQNEKLQKQKEEEDQRNLHKSQTYIEQLLLELEQLKIKGQQNQKKFENINEIIKQNSGQNMIILERQRQIAIINEQNCELYKNIGSGQLEKQAMIKQIQDYKNQIKKIKEDNRILALQLSKIREKDSNGMRQNKNQPIKKLGSIINVTNRNKLEKNIINNQKQINQVSKDSNNNNNNYKPCMESIINMNDIINYMISYLKGFTRNGFRFKCWATEQGESYIRKLKNSHELMRQKYSNFQKIRQLCRKDKQCQEVIRDFQLICNFYFTQIDNSLHNNNKENWCNNRTYTEEDISRQTNYLSEDQELSQQQSRLMNDKMVTPIRTRQNSYELQNSRMQAINPHRPEGSLNIGNNGLQRKRQSMGKIGAGSIGKNIRVVDEDSTSELLYKLKRVI